MVLTENSKPTDSHRQVVDARKVLQSCRLRRELSASDNIIGVSRESFERARVAEARQKAASAFWRLGIRKRRPAVLILPVTDLIGEFYRVVPVTPITVADTPPTPLRIY